MPGVDLGRLPMEESAKLKRAVLDLYRLSHARGFKAGADHAMNAFTGFIQPRLHAPQMQWPKRLISERIREYWKDYKKSLNSIRAIVIRKFREE